VRPAHKESTFSGQHFWTSEGASLVTLKSWRSPSRAQRVACICMCACEFVCARVCVRACVCVWCVCVCV
jgi:hypothetical protein